MAFTLGLICVNGGNTFYDAKIQRIPLNPLMAFTLGLMCVIGGHTSMVPKCSVYR